MFRFKLFTILSLISISVLAQRNNSKVQVYEENGAFGVKSGKRTIVTPAYKEIRLEDNNLIAVKDTMGVWGYFDEKGNSIVPPRFIETQPFYNGMALVKKEDGWGAIDEEGKFVIKPLYKHIVLSGENTFKATPFPEVRIMTSKKDTLATFLTDSITSISENIYSYFLDGNAGLLDKSGSKITLPLYQEINPFKGNITKAKRENKWGVMDQNGKEIIPVYFDSIVIDTPNMIRGKATENQGEQWHLFDGEGKPLFTTPVEFIDEINPYSVFIFKQGGKMGLMTSTSQPIVEPIYATIKRDGNFYVIHSNQKQGLMSLQGQLIYPPHADSIKILPGDYLLYSSGHNHQFLSNKGLEIRCSTQPLYALDDGLLEIRKNQKKGRMDFDGKIILDAVYDSIGTFTDSALVLFKGNHIGLYNYKRDTLIGPDSRIQQIFPESEGFYGVKIKGKFGFVDNLGRIRIANRYEGIGKFVEGYAPVKLLGKWGFIDKAEILRVQPSFDEVADFQNGISIVKKNGKYGLINKRGQIVADLTFEGFERTLDDYFISIKKNNRNQLLKGLINSEGKEVIYAKYEELEYLADGNVIVKKNNRFGVVNSNDLIIFSTIYKSIEFDENKRNYILIKEREAEELKIETSKKR